MRYPVQHHTEHTVESGAADFNYLSRCSSKYAKTKQEKKIDLHPRLVTLPPSIQFHSFEFLSRTQQDI